jgi:hypothetical protein
MRQALYSSFIAGMLAVGMAHGLTSQATTPTLGFSGYVDADFASSFAPGGFKNAKHLSGLEIDLTTTVTFSPKLNAVLYTTMNDGIVPGQGAGRTWDDVNFDGVTLNWLYDAQTTLFIGDIIYGTGYFNYYGNKRSAVVVGEHAVRGVGFTREGLTVSTGATGLGAVDTAGNPVPTSQWATFVKYDWSLGANGSNGILTPSAKYIMGVPGATPFVGGLSYDAKFGDIGLSADVAADYYNADYDPGFTVLVEPSYASGKFSVAGALFYNKKGKNALDSISPSAPRTTLPVDAGEGSTGSGRTFDDLMVYVEPGMTLSPLYAVGLPVEYHDPSAANAAAQGYDASVWVVPTFYIYPGSAVQWWIWGQIVQPLKAVGTGSKDIRYLAGSELIFRF